MLFLFFQASRIITDEQPVLRSFTTCNTALGVPPEATVVVAKSTMRDTEVSHNTLADTETPNPSAVSVVRSHLTNI